ncbi:hypothetical protein AOQ84DRAFT_312422, partial [Glonium stellatum]
CSCVSTLHPAAPDAPPSHQTLCLTSFSPASSISKLALPHRPHPANSSRSPQFRPASAVEARTAASILVLLAFSYS